MTQRYDTGPLPFLSAFSGIQWAVQPDWVRNGLYLENDGSPGDNCVVLTGDLAETGGQLPVRCRMSLAVNSVIVVGTPRKYAILAGYAVGVTQLWHVASGWDHIQLAMRIETLTGNGVFWAGGTDPTTDDRRTRMFLMAPYRHVGVTRP